MRGWKKRDIQPIPRDGASLLSPNTLSKQCNDNCKRNSAHVCGQLNRRRVL